MPDIAKWSKIVLLLGSSGLTAARCGPNTPFDCSSTLVIFFQAWIELCRLLKTPENGGNADTWGGVIFNLVYLNDTYWVINLHWKEVLGTCHLTGNLTAHPPVRRVFAGKRRVTTALLDRHYVISNWLSTMILFKTAFHYRISFKNGRSMEAIELNLIFSSGSYSA